MTTALTGGRRTEADPMVDHTAKSQARILLDKLPQTPNRVISSPFSSPSIALRGGEDEPIVLEIGARSIRVGFSNEYAPRCAIAFGPDAERRVGDYRQWGSDHAKRWRERRRGRGWGEAYELWRMDIRGLDLGLVEDKIDRAVREAYNKYLLVDPKPRRLFVALPAILPHALLSCTLAALFSQLQCPSIVLLPTPVLTTVAAGLRSSLVIDIGWAETVITAIFEYREVHSYRTERAAKAVTQQMCKALATEVRKARGSQESTGEQISDEEAANEISFEDCEEVLARLAWCRSYDEAKRSSGGANRSTGNPASPSSISKGMGLLKVDDPKSSGGSEALTEASDPAVAVSLQSTDPPMRLHMPFSHLAHPVETALLGPESPSGGEPDDHELPVQVLAYHALQRLPVDVRAICMSRITIVGGCSAIPGLRQRIVDEVEAMVKHRGWEQVATRGRPVRKSTQPRSQTANGNVTIDDVGLGGGTTLDGRPGASSPYESNQPPAAFVEQESDPIADRIRREDIKQRNFLPEISGVFRCVESLGPWAGASLAAGLKIKAAVEVDRERFLSHGLASASKDTEGNSTAQRMSVGPNGPRAGTGDRSSWSLGLWA